MITRSTEFLIEKHKIVLENDTAARLPFPFLEIKFGVVAFNVNRLV